MGGAVSLFDQNDWSIADGGLSPDDDTIDGRPPTASYETYFLLKKAVLANQREFEVTDSKSNLLYTIRPSTGTIAGFDVLRGNAGPKDDDDNFLLHVTVDLARRYWTIHRVNNPFYPGQLPDEDATAKFAMDLTRKDITTRLSESLAVTSFVEKTTTCTDAEVATSPEIQEAPPPKYLLYKACCVTVSWSRYMAVASYYGPPSADQILAYNSSKAPTCDETNANNRFVEEEDEDELFHDAASIAARMKERSAIEEANEMGTSADTDTAVYSAVNANNSAEDATMDSSTEKSNYPAALTEAVHNKDDQDQTPPSTAAPQISQRSLADDLVSESNSIDDEVEDLANRVIMEIRSHHEIDAEVSSTPTLTTSSSMPDLAGTRQNSFRSWIKQKSRDFHKTISSTNFQIQRTDSTDQDGSPKSQQQQTLKNLFPLGNRPVKLPNPDEGVVHLDKPLLLCQEIYNKIIGNHQTSRVTKERVLSLLKQDMAQHERNEETSSNDESSSIEVVDGRGPMVCAVSETPGNGVEESKEDTLTQETEQQPLVGYWNWENTIRTHKMKMHLAKGSDLALHIVLAVLVNQVRYERNAIAMTV